MLLIATGAAPQTPPVPGTARKEVVLAEDILAGKAGLGTRVAVIGGGGVGCETADFMAQRGKRVTLVEMMPSIGPATGIPVLVEQVLRRRLLSYGVELKCGATVKEIAATGITIEREGKEELIAEINQVVVATGAKSCNELETRLEGQVPEIYVIGDAKRPRTAFEATHEGAEVARMI